MEEMQLPLRMRTSRVPSCDKGAISERLTKLLYSSVKDLRPTVGGGCVIDRREFEDASSFNKEGKS